MSDSFRIIEGICASGSRQLSKAGLEALAKERRPLIVVDLRRECHGFLDGSPVSWKVRSPETGALTYLYNQGKGADEIERMETELLRDLGDKRVAATEREIVEGAGAVYIRLPVLDNSYPSPKETERFSRLIASLPEGAWIHFHCAGGAGRTTVLLAMLQMMRDPAGLSLEEILRFQEEIGGANLYDPERRYKDQPDRIPGAVERLEFLKRFDFKKREPYELMSASPHSAAFLNAKHREFWWNPDYLDLLARRVDFSGVRTALDVGCGKGAWTRVIGSILPEGASIVGVDREPEWIASCDFPQDRFRFSVADAHALPFEEGSFDLVSCQTLLMHVRDHKQVLAEMARVLKPGGLMVLSEPTNMANLSASNTAQETLSLEEKIDAARLYLVCQEGKFKAGEGFSSIGLHLNYLLPDSIDHLHSSMSEKMMLLTPPYKNEDDQALIDFIRSITGDDWYYFWPKDRAEKYFLGVYPDRKEEFERLWQVAVKLNRTYRRQIEEGTLGGVFGGHLILTIGEKRR